jgi:hypothetical protein
MPRCRVEQETIINFNEGEPGAEIYTASRRVASKLLRTGLTPKQQTPSGWWFEVPKQAVRIKVGRHHIRIGGEVLQLRATANSEGG